MRKKEVKSIVNDLLNLGSWYNPLGNPFFLIRNKKIRVDLIKGSVLGCGGRDSLWEFYREKINWFKRRVKKLNGNLNDFQKAKIYIDNLIERIEIKYKGELFTGKNVWGEEVSNTNKIKKDIGRVRKAK